MQISRVRNLVILVIACFFVATTVFAQNANFPDDGIGKPMFTAISNLTTQPRTNNTVPHWTSSFTFEGTVFPFTMVGTNPGSSNSTTTVPTVLIPVKFVFANGAVLDGSTKVANVLGSPNFHDATYGTGITQFADAVQRAEFFSSVSTTSPDWHTLIGAPEVLPTQVIDVPQNQAVTIVGRRSGKLFALMSSSWFFTRFQNLLNELHISPTVLPIVQTYNVFLFTHNVGNCCILGFHAAFSSLNGNGNQQVQTAIFEAWPDPLIFANADVQDVLPLSHEVSEWMNDPFVNNAVPVWQFPGIPGACQGNLETGDPVEVLAHPAFPVTINGFTYHPQTEALLQWFSREVPSSAIDGAYSYPNEAALTSPSTPCP
jgi:hypothetical protein